MSPYDLERLCDDLPGIPAKPTRVVLVDPPRQETRGTPHHARLTEMQVRAMRIDRSRGCSFMVLAELYGVSPEHAQAICARRAWRHVA